MPTINTAARTNVGDKSLVESCSTAVEWPAIIGGAVASAAFTVLLAPLGNGLGWSSWHDPDKMQKAITLIGAVWLILVQWVSSGVGGYLTGRLRTGWADAHTHEVFFRDTVHGFLTWALVTIIGIVLLTGGAMHMHKREGESPNGAWHAMFTPENEAAARLFRADAGKTTEQDRAEAAMILSQNADEKSMSESDRAYLAQLVHARTGLSAAESQKRVDENFMQLRETQEQTHKAVTIIEIMMFLSMWVGAFIASAAAALGGQHRDVHYTTGSLRAD